MAKRLSITLTDTQEQALDALAAESGASLQSMVGLAVSAWLRGQQPQGPAVDHDELAEICARQDRSIRRSTVQVAREVVTHPQHAESHDEDEDGPLCEVCGKPAVWFSEDEDGTTHYTCDEH